jgi:hypothetical protein
MTIRAKLTLQLLAVFVSAAACPSFAQNQPSSAGPNPDAASTVTTTGGTAGAVPLFSGASTIVNSNIFQTSSGVGIGLSGPATALDVNGQTTLRGDTTLLRTGTPTSSAGTNSHVLIFSAGALKTTTGLVKPSFQWRAEPTGNNTASPKATLNLLTSDGVAAPAETGFHFNPDGTIQFAPGQTVPGGAAFCIATNGGFGNSGQTFVATSFTLPAVSKCTPWAGFTKASSTVILTTSGTACLSSTGKTLTVSVSSADPDFLGTTPAADYIQLTRSSSTGVFTAGNDEGEFSGSSNQVTCTSDVLSLPDSHD